MNETTFDVFISHAYEDKNSFTNELAVALKDRGLKVWYSGFELKLGDSITNSVNKALKNAQFAIVVISPVYLEKQWAMNELHGLFNQPSERKRLLPILHNISMDEIKIHLPLLADRYAISTDKGLDFIVHNVVEVITGKIDSEKDFGHYSENKSTNNSNTGYSGSITVGTGRKRSTENSSEQEQKGNSIGKMIIYGLVGLTLLFLIYYIIKTLDGGHGTLPT